MPAQSETQVRLLLRAPIKRNETKERVMAHQNLKRRIRCIKKQLKNEKLPPGKTVADREQDLLVLVRALKRRSVS